MKSKVKHTFATSDHGFQPLKMDLGFLDIPTHELNG
jgi:hypothetical protein